jgi:pyruvate/2-oxoglutarate dehydrogenase complex dihydrolipoamide dehydrogenase (E3) component
VLILVVHSVVAAVLAVLVYLPADSFCFLSTGCVPSKSLLASAKAAQMARKFAIQTNSKVPMVNFAQVQTYFRKNQQDIYERDDSPEAMAAFNVDTLKGMATLTSPQTLSVSTKQDETNASESTTTTTVVTANEGIILCTGATAAMADIPGLADVRVVTYEDVWQLDALPKRLTVVGGGPIGVELAQAMSRLGSQVTIVASQLLPREEPEVSKVLQQVFEEDEGMTCVKGRLDKVERSGGNGAHKAYVSNGDSSQVVSVEGDVILLSVGRKPNTKGLGLENVGIGLTDNGGISVDDKLQTSVKGIYAAGDCIGEKQFTHYAGTCTILRRSFG